VVPALLPAKGGDVEVVLTGAGRQAGNVSVHPTPLDHKLYTTDPKPETLNPQPETMNHKP